MGLRINELVAKGIVKAPVVIGRDHLDAGSVASPFRETEAMRDGSDAIADWPVLNALLNTASGASWVSYHHGGGVGIGYALHAGQATVAGVASQYALYSHDLATYGAGSTFDQRAAEGFIYVFSLPMRAWGVVGTAKQEAQPKPAPKGIRPKAKVGAGGGGK